MRCCPDGSARLARVAVLARDMPRGTGATGRLLGSVFAHRLFDLFPALILTGFVLATAKIPRWAITSLEIAIVAGIAIFLATRCSSPGSSSGRCRTALGRCASCSRWPASA